MSADAPFWKTKTLDEMSNAEWESLCDGCGRCCLHKLIYEDANDQLVHTNVACRLLDLESCQCSNYPQRQKFVPDCVSLTPVHTSGVSVRGRAIGERVAGPLDHHIVDWPGTMPRPRQPKPGKPT